MNNLIADKGYDNSKLMIKLKDRYDINPIIDIRNKFGTKELKEIDNKPLEKEVFKISIRTSRRVFVPVARDR